MNDQEEIPPSRRRGRPPRNPVEMAPQFSTLAPPQESPMSDGNIRPNQAEAPTVPSLPSESQVPASEPDAQRIAAPHPVQPLSPAPAPLSGMDPSWVPVMSNDIVQVTNNESKYYGTLFIVGDVRNRKVHGYHLLELGKHSYFTVGEDEVIKVGVSKVRSRKSCNDRWQQDYRL